MTAYCSFQTYAATRLEPSEFCETQVDGYGDLCVRHDEDDRADALYDDYLESLRKE